MEISLVVKEARQRDTGRGIVRIDVSSLEQLSVSAGEAISLEGKKKTIATAWSTYSEDNGKRVIRMDGFIRKNAGASIDDTIKVRPVITQEARHILLAPVDMRLNVDEDFTNFVKNRLMERNLTEGDTILVTMLGHSMPFTVCRVSPKDENIDGVKVSENTHFNIWKEPIDRKNTKVFGKSADLKMLFRNDWLRLVSTRLNAKKTTFSIADEEVEKENESDALQTAKTINDSTWEPVGIAVNFYSDKGDLIGSLPWIVVDLFGNPKAVYPDSRLPPIIENLPPRDREETILNATTRRCFKIGTTKCPKEVRFSPKMVFVAMPFKAGFQDLYKYAIRPALEEIDLSIWKADERISNIDIMCKICQGIQECSCVIANISDWNPNVLFEIGLAYGFGKSVILIKDRKEKVPVDLKGLEYIEYETIDELKRNILAFFKSMKI
ncbi:hypothetical protein MUP01_04625 [Candidatus Bathyarchaeota archaeon]|nr:hypothetical protein [Candidatus Bathyarchaeota archaeon]